MIQRSDILSIPFLKKSPFTGSFQGIRYRLEKLEKEGAEGEKKICLQAAVWEEPYSFAATPEEQKEYREFAFSEEGICEIVDWLNERWQEKEGRRGQRTG